MVKLSCYELGNATRDGIYDLHLLFDDAASGNGVLAKLRLLYENVRLLPPVFDMPQMKEDDDEASGGRGMPEDLSDVPQKGCFLSIRFFAVGAHRAKEAVYTVLMEHLDVHDQEILRQDLAQSRVREAQVSARKKPASGDDLDPSGSAIEDAVPTPA